MKLKELLYLVGIRPAPKKYGHKVVDFQLQQDGLVQYAQWLHPGESDKQMKQAAVNELRKYVSPGDVAIDIGAHSGDTTIPLALAAGPKGCVLALEPNPYVYPVLEKNAQLNRSKTNIVPLMFAAVTEPGEVTFEYSDEGYCNGGRHEGISKWKHAHAFKLNVRGENLEAYLAKHYAELISRIRFIKVDAEGYDFYVLSSLKNLLVKQQPYIKAEVFKHLSNEQREKLYDFLVELGYDVRLFESDDNYCGQKLGRDELMSRPHYDLFCVPKRMAAKRAA